MRTLFAATAVILILGLSSASAMCGGGSSQGGSCGRTTAVDDPSNEKPAMSKKPTAGMGMMCGCCKNMAAMEMPGRGSTKEDDPHKGMDMPKR